MPTETRYMRSDERTVNCITARKLDTTNTVVGAENGTVFNGNVTVYLGVRVYRRKEDCSLVEITSGEPVAVVSRSVNGSGMQSATWECPKTLLELHDCIQVDIYWRASNTEWVYAGRRFITDRFTDVYLLKQVTWSFYYYTERNWLGTPNVTWWIFSWGDSYTNSRIENFVYVTLLTVTRRLGDVKLRSRGWLKVKKIEDSIETIKAIRRPHILFKPERAVPLSTGNTLTRARQRLRAMYEIEVKRNGKTIHHYKRERDLLVWRGQRILAYLLSQGAVGDPTDIWKIAVSSNSTAPDMGDDSGNPVNNEFNPLIASLADVTYEFEPMEKPSGGYQTFATLYVKGTTTISSNATLRKIGIVDTVTSPAKNIICEDAVVPVDVLIGDVVLVTYLLQLA